MRQPDPGPDRGPDPSPNHGPERRPARRPAPADPPGPLTRLRQIAARFRAFFAGLGWGQSPVPARGQVTHVIILDGTMSSTQPGQETNAGLTWRLLSEKAPSARMSLFYEPGIQWEDWRSAADVAAGRGINRQIRRAYGFLASRYRPGDRIYLFGYSRGAYAVRSLAGVIDRVGLLQAENATERAVREAWRLYENGGTAEESAAARAGFRARLCHPHVEIEMIGVWDTVKALGLRLPLLWRVSEDAHNFHGTELSQVVRHGFHALARDETRLAYAPVLWQSDPGWEGRLEQVWFRGTHGDIGGQLNGRDEARPLANVPLVWMLEKAEDCGLDLPEGWRARFPADPTAPSAGSRRGWGRVFLARRRRVIGADPSERLHPSAEANPHP
ncbi:MAG: hypothetical protein CL812_01600 [Confluentimicrobium sp.]|nr:hypothetical protein [Actibacterium sp.]